MNQAERVIEKLGGAPNAARILGKPKSTVLSWKYAGMIPAWQQQPCLDAARREGLPLEPADFFDPPAGGASESAA